MSQSLVPSIHQQTQQWRMKPAAALTDLESTGAAVFRWQRSSTDLYHFERAAPRDYALLSVMLAPMQTRATVGNRLVWNGSINSGQVRLLQPSQCASWDSHSTFDILHVHLPTEALTVAAQSLGLDFLGFRGTCQPLYQNDPVTYLIARQLALAMDGNCRLARTHADLSVQLLIVHLLKNYEFTTPTALQSGVNPGLVKAFNHIEHHPCEKLDIAQLATVATMSEFHFARQFKRIFGISPHAHVLAVRLRHARRALELSSKTVLEVALECGFVDSSHFARVFRKAFGISPAAFRRSRQVPWQECTAD